MYNISDLKCDTEAMIYFIKNFPDEFKELTEAHNKASEAKYSEKYKYFTLPNKTEFIAHRRQSIEHRKLLRTLYLTKEHLYERAEEEYLNSLEADEFTDVIQELEKAHITTFYQWQ